MFTPMYVNADNKIYFQQDKMDVMPDALYQVDIKVDSDSPFNRIDFNVITLSENVIFSKIKIRDAFTNSSDNGYSLEADEPQKSGTTVATVFFKISSDVSIGDTEVVEIADVTLTSDDVYYLENYSLELKVKEKNSNELSSLSSEIAPIKFSKDKLVYNVKVEENVDKFDLIATAEDPKAKVYISNQKLELRKNTIIVRVAKEGLPNKIYKVVVSKNVTTDNDITKENPNDHETSKAIKRKWIVVFMGVFVVFIVNMFFIVKRKFL